MSKPSNTLSGTMLEMRIGKVERSHNSLEARLINLTTLIKSNYDKASLKDSNDQSTPLDRILQLENTSEKHFQRLDELEQRISKIEELLPGASFLKVLESTHSQLKQDICELKDSIEFKEQRNTERIFREINYLKKKIDSNGLFKEESVSFPKKSDEIENIIKELQRKIDRNSETPKKKRSVSFSVLKTHPSNKKTCIKKKKKKIHK